MIAKALYKLLSLLLGAAGGLLAGKIFDLVWRRIAGQQDAPPEPDQKETTWVKVLTGAAAQGAIFALVKAAVTRGGAVGVEKATGTWPGATAADLEPAAA
jgi:hypothetical protein